MLRSMRPIPFVLAALLALTACKGNQPRPESTVSAEERAAPGLPTMEVDVAALDQSVEPCDDFYQYACGGWIAATPIPPDRPGWFRSFSEIQEHNVLMLRRILDETAAGKLQTPYG